MPSCPVPGPPVGSSALRASGTNRWTGGTSVITRRYPAVITENPPVNSALCVSSRITQAFWFLGRGRGIVFGISETIALEVVPMKQFKIVVEKHPDTYVAYPLGLKGVVVGQGKTYESALADVKSAIQFHIETFGPETLEIDPPILEAFIAEAGVPI